MEKIKTYVKNWAGIGVRAEKVFYPEKEDDIRALFESNGSFTFRGLGKNYTDAGLHPERIISNHGLNQIISFDEKTGIIHVQSGVVLHDLLMFCLPKGWIVPTVPGTAYITVGGMVASNVHGKNQYRVGSVADHIRQLTLRTPDNERIVCSPSVHPEIFNATVAGYGTTGMIEGVTFSLQKIKTPYLRTSYIKTTSISEQVEIMESKRNQSDFTIGWFAHNQLRGDKIQGLVEYAHYDSGEFQSSKKINLFHVTVPFPLPASIVWPISTKAFNTLTYRKKYPDRPIHFYEFNFKLDKVRNWNFLYGPKGFIQYQCLIPRGQAQAKHIQYVLEYLRSNDVMSALLVLKMHKTDPYGNFSFSRDGMSLAMDFPYSDRTVEILKKLNLWVMEIGGRVYLTKDRTMDCFQFWKMYDEELSRQRQVMAQVDPNGKMDSVFMQRLRVRG